MWYCHCYSHSLHSCNFQPGFSSFSYHFSFVFCLISLISVPSANRQKSSWEQSLKWCDTTVSLMGLTVYAVFVSCQKWSCKKELGTADGVIFYFAIIFPSSCCFCLVLSLKEQEQILTQATTGSVYSNELLPIFTKKDHYYYFSLYNFLNIKRTGITKNESLT